MSSSRETNDPPNLVRQGAFPSTHWSWVDLARGGSGTANHNALEKLCAIYWYPLYAFVRRQGHDAEGARDLTQAFFERLLAHDFLEGLYPSKGRLRSFLLTALTHFLSNERDRAQAQKRGGGTTHMPWPEENAEETYQAELHDTQTPAEEYDRRCGLALLMRAMEQVRADCVAEGWGDRFEALKCGLLGGPCDTAQEELATRLGMPVATVKTSLHRLRRRLTERLRSEVAATVTEVSEVDEGLGYLLRLMARAT